MPKGSICLFFFLATFELLATTNFEEETEHLQSLINTARKEATLTQLQNRDGVASTIATNYALKLSLANQISHYDAQNRTVLNRYREAGGSAITIGEVLAASSSLEEAVNAWLLSPAHKKILLNNHWTTLNIGLSKQNNQWFICVIFTDALFDELVIMAKNPHEIVLKLIKTHPPFPTTLTVTSGDYQQIVKLAPKAFNMLSLPLTLGHFVDITNEQGQGNRFLLNF